MLLERMDDVTRAHEYATKVDDVAVWSVLGHAQLQRGLVSDAIGSYLLAKDSSKYIEVIKRASETQQYADLVKYLMMVRKKVKDQTVDSEIVIAYAKTAQLGELENFISGTHQANLQVRCTPRILRTRETCKSKSNYTFFGCMDAVQSVFKEQERQVEYRTFGESCHHTKHEAEL